MTVSPCPEALNNYEQWYPVGQCPSRLKDPNTASRRSFGACLKPGKIWYRNAAIQCSSPSYTYKTDEKFVVGQSTPYRNNPSMKDQRNVIVQCLPCPDDPNKKQQRFTGPPYLKNPNSKEQRNFSGQFPCEYEPKKKNQHLPVADRSPCPKNQKELRKKELSLLKKEKQLLKLQKDVQKKQNQLKRKLDSKAKADLKAANKLNRARKKLQLAVKATNKIGRHHKTGRKNSLSYTKCMNPSKGKWLDKISSIMNKFQGSRCSYFSEKKRGLSELCALYAKKMAEMNRQNEELCLRCSDASRYLSFCSGGNTNRPQGRKGLEAAAGDCYGMAMDPVLWSWPYHRRTQNLTRAKLKHTTKYCCALLLSFMFWLPCLLCACYSCCCNDC